MTTAKLENGARSLHTDRHLIADRYRTHTRIGHGRLGEIFAAVDEVYEGVGVEKHLAIQIVPEDVVRNNKLFNKLNLGFTILRGTAHPNIVNFLHFGRDGRLGYLVMELLDGLSLRRVLDDAKMLALDEARPVIRGVGEALRLLHTKDMVHGNLTTKSVFITEELEVRLLDVLPLDASDAIARRTTMSEPFRSCAVGDDVFGLACLAYEMLAGKHPFNDRPPDEARLAGLKADRIASLNDREWNALRLALSFDREQRTSSVADFMRDFGISGTERLRPTMDRPTRRESFEYRAVEQAPPMTWPAGPAHAAAAPVKAVETIAWNEDRPSNARPIRKRTRPLRTALLGTLLAVLRAWFYYGQPQEQVEELISYVDKSMNVGLTASSDGIVRISTREPGRTVPMDRVEPVDRPASTAPAASVEATLADVEAARPESERTPSVEEALAALAQPTDQPAPAAPLEVENRTGTSQEAMNGTADEVSADADAGPMQTESGPVLIESIVSVSEGDGVARIAAPRSGSSAMPLIWWTSEHTADADTDFIPVEQQTMADVTIEDNNVLHIPLVNDYLPEPPESFFVNLGFHNTRQGHIERIATVRVDIVDDDST